MTDGFLSSFRHDSIVSYSHDLSALADLSLVTGVPGCSGLATCTKMVDKVFTLRVIPAPNSLQEDFLQVVGCMRNIRFLSYILLYLNYLTWALAFQRHRILWIAALYHCKSCSEVDVLNDGLIHKTKRKFFHRKYGETCGCSCCRL